MRHEGDERDLLEEDTLTAVVGALLAAKFSRGDDAEVMELTVTMSMLLLGSRYSGSSMASKSGLTSSCAPHAAP